MIIASNFSLKMVDEDIAMSMVVSPITLHEAQRLVRLEWWKSAIEDQAMAAILSDALGVEVPSHRMTVRGSELFLLVGQYCGPRLAEDTPSLPDGAEIKWFSVVAHPAW